MSIHPTPNTHPSLSPSLPPSLPAQFHGMRGNLAELGATQLSVFHAFLQIYRAYSSLPPSLPPYLSTLFSASVALPPGSAAALATNLRREKKQQQEKRRRRGEGGVREGGKEDAVLTMASTDPKCVLPNYHLHRPREEVKVRKEGGREGGRELDREGRRQPSCGVLLISSFSSSLPPSLPPSLRPSSWKLPPSPLLSSLLPTSLSSPCDATRRSWRCRRREEEDQRGWRPWRR